MGSFVENVNKLSLNLDTIVKANSTFDVSILPVLQEVADLDLQEVTEDLQKGNYLGNRKIDIDLSLNKLDSTSIVSYSKADITLVSGEIISIPFLSGASVLELTSHNDIRNYIVNDVLWAGIQYTECTVEESTDTTPTLIRFRDADGHSSNIERVELTVYSGTAKDIRPVYFWAQTTSALQTIANRVGDIIALGNNMSNVIELSQRIDELNELQAELTNILEIHSNLAEILEADTNAGIATTKAAEALASKIAALQALSDATTQATIATNQAIIATNKANEIKSITTQTATGAAGSLAQVSYNPVDGKFSFVIPQGLKGDRGEAFSVNAMGTFAQRTGYDAQPINFSYFATDMSLIYFKQSATSGDWSTGIPFGKGDKGDIGLTGNGIATIVRISGTGAAGTTDTYRITYTSGGTFDFNVYNGTQSDVDKAYVDAHKNDTANPHTVTKAQVGLGNVPNVDATLNIPSGNISSTTVQGAINELDSEKAIDTAVVHKTGDETIAGVKTFSSSPIVPTPTTDFQATTARSTNITVNVGAGQTYTTINQALGYLSGFYPLYKKSGIIATINLKAGFVMNEQVLVSGLNLGWITIVGEDAETIITHTALTTAFYGSYPAFGVDKGGTSPVIGQLFRFSVEKVGGEKHGLMAYGAGSSADVLSGKGFIGAGTHGIYAEQGSAIHAQSTNVSSAGASGICAVIGSTINAQGANASNAGYAGIYAVNGSTVNAQNSNASNAGAHGIFATNSSTINASNALVQNQTTGTTRVLVIYGSTINVIGMNTTGGTVPALSQTANTLTANGIIFQ